MKLKTNLKAIQEAPGHHNTVLKKQLISEAEKKGGVATFNYAWLKKGMTVEPHSHDNGEEFYLFLSGKGKMLIGDEWFSVEKDDFVTVQKDQVHSLKNEINEDLVFITLRTILL